MPKSLGVEWVCSEVGLLLQNLKNGDDKRKNMSRNDRIHIILDLIWPDQIIDEASKV